MNDRVVITKYEQSIDEASPNYLAKFEMKMDLTAADHAVYGPTYKIRHS